MHWISALVEIYIPKSQTDGVMLELLGAELAASSEAAGEKAPKRKIKVEVPRWCGQWVVGMDHFREGVVGAKSKNIAGALLWRSSGNLMATPPAHVAAALLRVPRRNGLWPAHSHSASVQLFVLSASAPVCGEWYVSKAPTCAGLEHLAMLKTGYF